MNKDEKFVEEKARELENLIGYTMLVSDRIKIFKHFIRSLFAEVQPQKSIEDNELFEIKAQEYERGLKDAMVTKKPDEGKVEKFADDLMDLVVDSVDCRHSVDEDGAGQKYDCVEYDMKDCQEFKEKIKKMLEEFGIL